jgi:hypothetical protein
MPPASQTDFSKPQGQRIIQLRDDASRLRAQLAGRIDVKNFWTELILDLHPLKYSGPARSSGLRLESTRQETSISHDMLTMKGKLIPVGFKLDVRYYLIVNDHFNYFSARSFGRLAFRIDGMPGKLIITMASDKILVELKTAADETAR